jgi:hypothetical protein
VSFFFGVQYKLLNNIQNTYILNDKNKWKNTTNTIIIIFVLCNKLK